MENNFTHSDKAEYARSSALSSISNTQITKLVRQYTKANKGKWKIYNTS